jgi:hypothetical protein
MAASYLSSELNATFHIDKLEVTSWESIKLKNLVVQDQQQDTLVKAGILKTEISILNFRENYFKLNSISLEEADIRLKKYRSDSTINFQFIVDYFVKKDKEAKIEKKDLAFALKKLSIINSAFIFEDQCKEHKDTPIKFTDIGITELNLFADSIQFFTDSLSVNVSHISLKEKSGFEVDSLSCTYIFSKHYMGAKNLLATTPKNKLNLDFYFTYNNMEDFQDFINKVKINTQIRPTLLNLSEVGYFAPVMFSMDNKIRVMADIEGTVSNFKAKELKFGLGNSTQFRGNIRMNGLPYIKETFTNLSIDLFKTNVQDVRKFRLPTPSKFIALPENFTSLGHVDIAGNFTGFYNDFVSYGKFKTEVGTLKTDILLRVNHESNIAYDGHIIANDFNAGKFFNAQSVINKLDIEANIVGSGVRFDNMEISMVGAVDSLELFGYVYNEIEINGNLTDRKYTGDMIIKDDFINLDFNGSIDYGANIPEYNFVTRIEDAYLQEINILSNEDSSIVSTQLNVNLMGDNLDNMQGMAKLDSTYFSNNGESWFMEHFAVSITRESDNYAFINLFSDILNASIEGNYTFTKLPENILLLMNQYLNNLIPDSRLANIKPVDQDFIFNLELKNTQSLTDIFIPQLSVSPGFKISGGYNSRINNLFFDGMASQVTLNDMKARNFQFEFFIDDDSPRFIATADRFFLSDTLYSDSLKLDVLAKENKINTKFVWNQHDHSDWSNGSLNAVINVLASNRYIFSFEESEIGLAHKQWQVLPDNNIVMDTNTIQFHNVGFQQQDQYALIHGNISSNPADTLLFEFLNFNLSNSDLFLKNMNLNIDGRLNGSLRIADYYQNPIYLGKVNITDLYYNNEKLGNFSLDTQWDRDIKALDINGELVYVGELSETKTLGVKGQYYPDNSDKNFDIDINLNKYKLTTLEPFTRLFSNKIEGMGTGTLHISGTKSKPMVTGEIDVNRTAMLINYLNVKYYFADKIMFDQNRIYFNEIIINDSLNNQAILTGDIRHNYLSDFKLDLSISTNNILGLNTTLAQNNAFYGDAFASGSVRIHGPVNNLALDIGLRSERGTNVKIPISYGTEVGSSEFIIFINEEEIKEEKTKEKYVADDKGTHLNIDLSLTNDAQIQMFMPYNMGNIRTRGHGDLRMTYLNTGQFTMEGEFNIDRGSFFFTLQNIINRDFDIRRGSKVSWTGDPYDAKINMIAVYKVKTTLGDFGPPQDSASRVPVDCIISLRNSLLDPEIKFTVEFPDLKEDTKQYIYSRLDTNDQALMSQQMMSLLVLNSFSSNSGYDGSVGFNTFSLLTNQLSNWLSQISNDFDIGVNYRPGDQVSSQEVEVALSTQLFDDRVLVDGNVGVKGSETSQNTNNIVGEVTVEVKITPEGNLRAKAFNKSNNFDIYTNYAPYTQGVGIFYTKEFNKLKEAFTFRKRKDKIKNKDEQSLLQ